MIRLVYKNVKPRHVQGKVVRVAPIVWMYILIRALNNVISSITAAAIPTQIIMAAVQDTITLPIRHMCINSRGTSLCNYDFTFWYVLWNMSHKRHTKTPIKRAIYGPLPCGNQMQIWPSSQNDWYRGLMEEYLHCCNSNFVYT